MHILTWPPKKVKSTYREKASTETIERRHTHVKKAYYQVNKAMCTYSPGKVKSACREKASNLRDGSGYQNGRIFGKEGTLMLGHEK